MKISKDNHSFIEIGGKIIMDKKKMMNWIIAIIVAIVYLTVSIIFKSWAYSWLIWVAYAIYRFIVK